MKLLTSLVLSVCALAPLVSAAHAQNLPLAPPISAAGNAMWMWQDIPRDERIPITRALFDQNGYVLYDADGQMISVPFNDNNLYVMQFGRTSGEMYFVNEDGRTPTLYLPANGFLENGCVSGARWYPFPERYYYTRPVYLGIAPSWDDYCRMGWHTSTIIYGGYGGYQPWRYGVTFRPLPGLYISINGRSCRDWDDYCGYWRTTSIRPVVIVDRRPSYRQNVVIVDRRDRPYYSNSRGGGDRSGFRPSTMRPDYKAPARETESRGQYNNGGGFGSRETRGNNPLPSWNDRRDNRDNTDRRGGYSVPERSSGSVDRNRSTGSGYPSGSGYPNRDTNPSRETRSSGNSGSVGGSPLPGRTSREAGSPSGRESYPGRESGSGRDSYRSSSTGRDFSPPRESVSRGESGSGRSSSPGRESRSSESRGSGNSGGSSRERERGRK